MLNCSALIPEHDVLMITFDTLRFDVAQRGIDDGLTPNLQALLPGNKWELRHTPGNFTYAAHHAFFAGFLPTPVPPGNHKRLFAAKFAGSETTGGTTCVFDTADIVSGFQSRGYHTVCIGGVGFFNKQNPLGSVLPGMFAESHWNPSIGVTDPDSTKHQVDLALSIISRLEGQKRLFLFINISALHQPNCMYSPGATEDSVETQLSALAYVDRQLPPLFTALRKRAPVLALLFSDHGTAYGEDGYRGHRNNHSVVLNVPYAEAVLEKCP
ncbi:MAG: STM4013/SEN3800 family hydrolase [Candidatus Obscuribacterales bacterium]|nr:STM4013/SEN3800 family hydrolase [Candidatus Obscuribacterales bacterium]